MQPIGDPPQLAVTLMSHDMLYDAISVIAAALTGDRADPPQRLVRAQDRLAARQLVGAGVGVDGAAAGEPRRGDGLRAAVLHG
jgi:hypothetical protein